MEHTPFPAGPYYVYYLDAVFRQGAKLPPVIEEKVYQPKAGYSYLPLFLEEEEDYDQLPLKLSGAQITPQLAEALLQTIHEGKLSSLYLTPFRLSSQKPFYRLMNQWNQVIYTSGCGALVFDQDRASVFYRRLDQYTLNRHIPLSADDPLLFHPPMIFESCAAVADAIANLILTGSPDGSKARPPVPSAVRRGVDPGLLRWIENVLGQVPQSLDSLKDVTELRADYYAAGYPEFPDWLAPEPGNWSLLGDLPNLKVLLMPEVRPDSYDFLLRCPKLERIRLDNTDLSDPAMLENLPHVTCLSLPPAEFKDYSFLLRCPALENLDLSRTDFRDCSILAQMPALKRVLLPAERQLLYLDMLAPLPVKVKTDPRRVRGEGIDRFEVIEAGPEEPLDTAPPYAALYINAGGWVTEGLEITEKYVKLLMEKIVDERIRSLTISLGPRGVDERLGLNICEGWASLSMFTVDRETFGFVIPENYHRIYNPAYAGNYDVLPGRIGRPSPVPKVHAIQDLALAARCAAYFIKTGKLYPGAYWAKYFSE